MDEQVDILIIGGGLTGASLMQALVNQGLTVRLVEAMPFSDKITADFDARTLALSPASVSILQQLKVWPLLEKKAVPINTIHISEQGLFGNTLLNNTHQEPLGFVVEMQHINAALHQLLDKQSLLAPAKIISLDQTRTQATISYNNKEHTVKARLIIAADGAHSTVRRLAGLTADIKDYQQQAIIANVGLNRPHQSIAYERFTASGPLALLPMSDQRASLVWALPSNEITAYQQLNDVEFLKKLQLTFGYRLGRFNQIGKRFVYPLQQIIMPKPVAWPLVFIGNAAHTLHPVAGQGFNLGLRDAALLAQCILQQELSATMLDNYYSLRRLDQTIIKGFTNNLIDIFTSKSRGITCLRSLGFMGMQITPGIKQLLMHYTQGFGGITPNLVCGLPLSEQQ